MAEPYSDEELRTHSVLAWLDGTHGDKGVRHRVDARSLARVASTVRRLQAERDAVQRERETALHAAHDPLGPDKFEVFLGCAWIVALALVFGGMAATIAHQARIECEQQCAGGK